jgi:hypothetical protein
MCGRALRDAVSVETGIGPVCREKHGFGATYDAMTARQRKAVNRLIHTAGVACEDGDVAKILDIAAKIEKRGFTSVADKIRARYVKIRIHRAEVDEFGWTPSRGEFALGNKHKVLQVWTPYSPEFNEIRKSERLRGRPVRQQSEHGNFHWEFKVEHGVDLMRVLAQCFPGQGMLTDKGTATIPTPAEFNATYGANGARKI